MGQAKGPPRPSTVLSMAAEEVTEHLKNACQGRTSNPKFQQEATLGYTLVIVSRLPHFPEQSETPGVDFNMQCLLPCELTRPCESCDDLCTSSLFTKAQAEQTRAGKRPEKQQDSAKQLPRQQQISSFCHIHRQQCSWQNLLYSPQKRKLGKQPKTQQKSGCIFRN